MHELQIAEELAGIVLEVAANEHLSKVSRVNVSFGQLAGVVPELFETAFQVTVAGTIAENAALEIETIPVKLKCSSCNAEYQVKENNFVCENCGSFEIEIISGREMYVKNIEGE